MEETPALRVYVCEKCDLEHLNSTYKDINRRQLLIHETAKCGAALLDDEAIEVGWSTCGGSASLELTFSKIEVDKETKHLTVLVS
jgi:hypothetical protein